MPDSPCLHAHNCTVEEEEEKEEEEEEEEEEDEKTFWLSGDFLVQ